MLLVMMVNIFFVNVFADGPEYEGSCRENVRYSFNEETGKLTINSSVIGKMYDYSHYNYVPWYAYRDNIKSVEIDNGVPLVIVQILN